MESQTAQQKLTVTKASNLVGVSASTFRRLEEDGRISSVRLPNGYRVYNLEDVQNLKQALENEKNQAIEAKQKVVTARVESHSKVVTQEKQVQNTSSYYNNIQKITPLRWMGTVSFASLLILFVVQLILPNSFIKGASTQLSSAIKSAKEERGTTTQNSSVLGFRIRNEEPMLFINIPVNLNAGATVSGDLLVTGASNLQSATATVINTPVINMTGTAIINDLLDINEVTKSTLENTLELSGDAEGVLSDVTVTSVNGVEFGEIDPADGNIMMAVDGIWDSVTQDQITQLGTIDTGVWEGTIIAPEFGGTGLSSYSTGDLIYASASNTLDVLEIGAANYILTSSGSVPQWASINDIVEQSFFLQGGVEFGENAILGTNDIFSLIFETGNTEAMRIDTNGNVGIGTTNPTNTLHVVGNAYISEGLTVPNIRITSGAGLSYILRSDASGNATWFDASAWDQNSSNDLTVSTTFGGDLSGTYDNLTINPETIDETNLLTGSTAVDNYILAYDEGTGGFSWVSPSTVGVNYWSRVGSLVKPATNGDYIATTGRIGAGTTDPSYALHVVGSGYISLGLQIGTGLTSPTLTLTSGSGAGYILQSDANGNASWFNASGWDQDTSDDYDYWTVGDNDSVPSTFIVEKQDILRFASSDGNILTDLLGVDDADDSINFSIRLLRDIVAGDGLAGGLDDVLVGADADVIISLTTPGTLSVTSTNLATGSHTHSITSSANPGSSSSLLATSSTGGVQLIRLGIGAEPTADNRITMSNGSQMGQTGGPLITFDTGNGELEFSGTRILIGTTAATQELHVQGGAYISNTLEVGSGLTVPVITISSAPGLNYILRSDNSGNASWMNVSAWDQSYGDDLTTATEFNGDVTGTYTTIDIKENIVGDSELVNNLSYSGTLNLTGVWMFGGAEALSDASEINLLNGRSGTLLDTILIGDTGAASSGASFIGVYDEFTNSSSFYLQDILKDFDSILSAGSSRWTDADTFTYLTQTTDDLAVGAGDTGAPFYFDVSEGVLRVSGGITVPSFQLTSNTVAGSILVSDANGIATWTIPTSFLTSVLTSWDTTVSDDLTVYTTFLGDVTGLYDNLQIGPSTIGNNELVRSLSYTGTLDLAGVWMIGGAEVLSDASEINLLNGRSGTLLDTILIGDTGAASSGASFIGVYDEFTNSSSFYLQDILKDFDSVLAAGSSKWSDLGSLTYLTNLDYNLAVGGSDSTARFYFDYTAGSLKVTGGMTTPSLQLTSNTSANSILVSDANGNATWTIPSSFLSSILTSWDTTVSDDLTMADFDGWDTTVSDDLTAYTTFLGDVTGLYDNLQIGPSTVGNDELVRSMS
ncbi:MAG: helix-turn-helix domain-containing protein [Patescibacteria group bacterium]|jgi:DNA-binding transcriptional MerR regulator